MPQRLGGLPFAAHAWRDLTFQPLVHGFSGHQMVTFHTHGLANGRLLEDRPVDGAESAGRPYGWS